MSAQPVRDSADDPPAGEPTMPAGGSRRDEQAGIGRLSLSHAMAGRPVPGLVLTVAALALYAVVVVSAGGFVGVGLASIPLFLAAALLQTRGALLTAVATFLVTIIPSIARGHLVITDMAMLAEVTVLIVAALGLRVAVERLLMARRAEDDRDADRNERIRSVLGIAERLTRTFDKDEIFRTVVAETQRVLESDGVTIRIAHGDRLEIAAWSGIDDDVARRLPTVRIDEGWFGLVFRTGLPWPCDDVPATIEATRDAGSGDLFGRFERVIPIGADLVVPLVGHDGVIGAISVVRTRPYHWEQSDIDFVSALATHATVAIQNAELYVRSEVRAAQMGVLQAASARMNRQNSVESVGRAIVEETRRIIDYHNARVYVLEPPDALVAIAFAGTVGAYKKMDLELLRTELGRGFTGWVAQHGKPLLIHDANLDPRGVNIPGTDEVEESMLVVPVIYDERVTGAITLSKLGHHQFSEEDQRLLTILADQAATALESARLLARTRGLAQELQRLVDMSGDLAHSLDPLEVADLIARHLAEAIDVDQCAISYWDRSEDRILTWGYFPSARPGDLRPDYPLVEFPETRRVLEDQVTVIIDVDDPAADQSEVALLRANGDQRVVMLPLVVKGQSIGLVEMLSTSTIRLDDARIELIRTMANEAAMALENAKLYEEARRLADRDQLTGFYNHRYLHERLGEETVRAQRSRTPLSMLMIDLDDFKLVNDTFGHLFGDRVLVWSAEIIRSSLRASDLPARYGGDEFAVILPDTDAVAAAAVARRMLDAFRDRPYESDARGPVPVAASIGIATFLRDGRHGQELIAAADASLYRVKHAGGRGAEATPERAGGGTAPLVVAAPIEGAPAPTGTTEQPTTAETVAGSKGAKTAARPAAPLPEVA